MPLLLSDNLKDKAQEFPESSYGANLVTLILSNNKQVKSVVLAWGSEIIKIGDRKISNENDLGFNISDIKDIISEI